MTDVQKELDKLFSNDLEEGLKQLAKEIEPKEEPISNYNTKQVIKEEDISNKNAKELTDEKTIQKIEEKIQEKSEELISDVNSNRALPDELSIEEGIPITKVTEGIHLADNTDNNELISTHNSDHALPDEHAEKEDVPISNVNAENMHEHELIECEPISNTNSSQFVGELTQS